LGDLARLAWHIGNRHGPCEVGDGWLRVLAGPVMARMLRTLGVEVAEVPAPFRPEGGACGDGSGMGNGHGHDGPDDALAGHSDALPDHALGDDHGHGA